MVTVNVYFNCFIRCTINNTAMLIYIIDIYIYYIYILIKMNLTVMSKIGVYRSV